MDHNCLFCGDDCLVVRPKNAQIAGEKRTYVILLTDVEIFCLNFERNFKETVIDSTEEMNGEEM